MFTISHASDFTTCLVRTERVNINVSHRNFLGASIMTPRRSTGGNTYLVEGAKIRDVDIGRNMIWVESICSQTGNPTGNIHEIIFTNEAAHSADPSPMVFELGGGDIANTEPKTLTLTSSHRARGNAVKFVSEFLSVKNEIFQGLEPQLRQSRRPHIVVESQPLQVYTRPGSSWRNHVSDF